MISLRVCDDIDECRRLWESLYPAKAFFDQWMVRASFHEGFKRPPHFVVAHNGSGKALGLLPLSWIDESQCFGCFPGETWQGKTWLEQNKIIAPDEGALRAMLESVPAPVSFRYSSPESLPPGFEDVTEDETGYLFYPGQYGYSYPAYMQEFSRKSRKHFTKERERFEAMGLEWRYDCLQDIEHLPRLNLESFGEMSYFSDPRFLASFEALISWMAQAGCLRVTTALVGGRIAAVDAGAVWGGEYVVFAGGTSPEFPGIAKMINLHHIEWSCARKLEVVDFLCGNFGWKERFHLTSRTLFEIRTPSVTAAVGSSADGVYSNV